MILNKNKILLLAIVALFAFACNPKKEEKKLLLPVYGTKTVFPGKDTAYQTIKDFFFT